MREQLAFLHLTAFVIYKSKLPQCRSEDSHGTVRTGFWTGGRLFFECWILKANFMISQLTLLYFIYKEQRGLKWSWESQIQEQGCKYWPAPDLLQNGSQNQVQYQGRDSASTTRTRSSIEHRGCKHWPAPGLDVDVSCDYFGAPRKPNLRPELHLRL